MKKTIFLRGLCAALLLLLFSRVDAQTYPYIQNFDALTSGVSVTGWANNSGSTFVVNTNGPVSGANSFGEASPTDGHRAVYTAPGTMTDGQILFSQKVNFVLNGNVALVDPVLRMDAAGNNGYLIAFSWGSTNTPITLYKYTAGSLSQIGSATSLGVQATNGQTIWIRAAIVGNQIEFKTWGQGTSEPASYTAPASWTDSTYTSGYAGLRHNQSSGYTPKGAADDITIDTIPTSGAALPSLSLYPATLTTAVAQTIKATGTNTAWTSGTTFSVTGGVSAAISGVTVNVAAQTATMTLNPGTASGTLTITASGGGTATLSALLPPVPLSNSVTFTRFLANPVISLGQSYGGVQADGLAAPATCFDAANNRWVLMCDAWSNGTSKWYNLIFTSPDLLNWTYLSQQSPTGSDYITGNGGLIKNTADGKFYRIYNHYSSSTGLPTGAFLQSSTDLVTWANENSGNAVIPASGAGVESNGIFDPGLVFNPNTSLYECWYIGQSATSGNPGRTVCYATSTDCKTWTKQGAQFGYVAWANNFGEPQAFYIGADRYITFDGGVVSGQRNNSIAVQKNSTGVYKMTFGVNNPEPANSWESVNVFDGCCVGPVDRGDGRGTQLWMLYAGSNITASTDATQSGIGLVYAPLPTTATTIIKRRVQ